MGSLEVVFSPDAKRDLEQIVRYIADRGDPEAAVRLGERLLDRISLLAHSKLALAGVPLKQRPHVRKLIEGNYSIYYRPFPKQQKVRILRFWHGARDPLTLKLDA